MPKALAQLYCDRLGGCFHFGGFMSSGRKIEKAPNHEISAINATFRHYQLVCECPKKNYVLIHVHYTLLTMAWRGRPTALLPPLPAPIKSEQPAVSQYTLALFRYDLSKLRAKGLVEKIPIPPATVLSGRAMPCASPSYLKLFERIDAHLTAGLLKPFAGDRKLADEKCCALDRYINASLMIWTRCCVPPG